jgi:hypothetical protein
MSAHTQEELARIYANRFAETSTYRGRVWQVLMLQFFSAVHHRTGAVLDHVFRCLKPGGRLVAMGPNIKFTNGAYWDFWDHHLALTETSLAEGLVTRGFEIERCYPKFLPYTIVGGSEYPLWILKVYLQFKILWRIGGKQFLVVARKPV